MIGGISLYLIFALLAGLLPAAFVPIALRNREMPGAVGLFLYIPAATIYAIATGVESLGPSGASLLLLQSVVFFASALGSAGWFLIAADFTGHVKPTRRVLYLALGAAFVASLLVLTNPVHQLMYAPLAELNADMAANRRPLYGISVLCIYTPVLLGVGTLASEILRARGLRRKQGALLLSSVIPPLVAVTISGTFEIVPVNLTPFGLIVGTGLLSLAVFRGEFLVISTTGRSQAVEQMTDPVIMLSQSNRVIDANSAARALFAAETDTDTDTDSGWNGTHAADFFDEAWADLSPVDGDTTATSELTVEDGGEQRYFDVNSAQITDTTGVDHGTVITLREITERKQTERRLRRMTQRYNIALEGTETGVWELDPNSDTIALGERTHRLFVDPGQAIETYDEFLDRVHPDDVDAVTDAYRRAVEDGTTDVECRVQATDGWRWLALRGKTYTDDAGEPVRITGIVYDITDRKRREEQLAEKNEFLDEFASVLAHDIATPLNVIENNARMIELEHDASRTAEIYDATERISGQIDALRSLAQQGHKTGDTEPVSLRAVAEVAWEETETWDATLQIRTADTVSADPLLLRELFQNLFENAVDHAVTPDTGEPVRDAKLSHDRGQAPAPGSTPDGEPVRSVADDDPTDESTLQLAAPSEQAVAVEVGSLEDGDGGGNGSGFYVADDGPGIPPEKRSRIFEQGYTTTASGSGFGLAIVQRIVESHGWEITVDTPQGDLTGAQFEIRTDAQ